jgi:hypothetical protein
LASCLQQPTQRTNIATWGHQANWGPTILPPPPAHAHLTLFHDSSSQSHTSLHMRVWLLLLRSDWPLSCNNPPNGQILPDGDTKQIGPRPSFRRPQHTLTALYFHYSSSQSHPSLHICVCLPLLRSGLRCTSVAVFSIAATTHPRVLNVPASLRYAQMRAATARF